MPATQTAKEKENHKDLRAFQTSFGVCMRNRWQLWPAIGHDLGSGNISLFCFNFRSFKLRFRRATNCFLSIIAAFPYHILNILLCNKYLLLSIVSYLFKVPYVSSLNICRLIPRQKINTTVYWHHLIRKLFKVLGREFWVRFRLSLKTKCMVSYSCCSTGK